jgi:hypothetical protein
MLDVDSSPEGESSICVFMVTVYIMATKPNESKNILLQIPCVLGKKTILKFLRNFFGEILLPHFN